MSFMQGNTKREANPLCAMHAGNDNGNDHDNDDVMIVEMGSHTLLTMLLTMLLTWSHDCCHGLYCPTCVL